MKALTTAGTATLGLPQCSPGTTKPDFSKKVGGYTGAYGKGEAGNLYVSDPVEGQVYTVSTDPDLIKVCNSAHKMSAEELAKELAFAVKIHCEYENG